MQELSKKEQREQLEKHIKRSYNVDEDQTRINGKNLFVYYTGASNNHIKQHDTETLSTDLPWELKRLFRDGLIDIKRIQFTIYPDEENVKGDRDYICFFHCIINWDNFTEEQHIGYWRANVHYP